MSVVTTTPPEITRAVRRLTESVVRGAEPVYLPVQPEADAIVHECFPNVQAKVARDGGQMLCGWQLWEWPHVLVEAEFQGIRILVWEGRTSPSCLAAFACRVPVSLTCQRLAFSVWFVCWRMSVQGGNQWASHLAAARTTRLHQLGQSRFHTLEVGQPQAHVCQACGCYVGGFVAMGAVLQLEQLRNLVQIESQSLGGLHELHPVHVRRPITADAADRAVRLRQQALALIEPDGFHVDSSGLGEGPDGQGFRIVHHRA